MTATTPFTVHVAGEPSSDHRQRCVPCGVVLMDNTAWWEQGVAVPVGQDNERPGWWPAGALIATDRQPEQASASITYVVDGRVDGHLDADERPCTPVA